MKQRKQAQEKRQGATLIEVGRERRHRPANMSHGLLPVIQLFAVGPYEVNASAKQWWENVSADNRCLNDRLDLVR